MNDENELIGIAKNAARIGSQLARKAPSREIHHKGDRDLVTDVDLAVEREIRSFLARETPDIGFLGEEEGGQLSTGCGKATWTLDPIDGTSNFAHGLPLCAISLALVEGGTPTIGVIVAPFMDLSYHAGLTLGAFVNGERMKTSRTSELANAIVSIGDYAVGENADAKNEKRIRLTRLLAAHVERIRMFGSAALDLAWVAEGRTDAAIILANKPWDTAAGVLIAREAGAIVVDIAGVQHDVMSTGTIAISPALANGLLSLLETLSAT